MFLRSRYSSPSRARTRIHSGRRPSTCSVTPASSRRRISRTGVPSDPPARRPGVGPAPPVRRPISTNWRSSPRSSRGEERRFEAAAPAPFWRSFSAISAGEERRFGAGPPLPVPASFWRSFSAVSAVEERQLVVAPRVKAERSDGRSCQTTSWRSTSAPGANSSAKRATMVSTTVRISTGRPRMRAIDVTPRSRMPQGTMWPNIVRSGSTLRAKPCIVRPFETFTPMAAIFSTVPDGVGAHTPVSPFSTPASTPRSARAAISTASRRRT